MQYIQSSFEKKIILSSPFCNNWDAWLPEKDDFGSPPSGAEDGGHLRNVSTLLQQCPPPEGDTHPQVLVRTSTEDIVPKGLGHFVSTRFLPLTETMLT